MRSQLQGNRRKFYTITAAFFVAIILFAVVIIVYTEDSYVKIEVSGSSRASFELTYDSTNVTVPLSQNVTVEVLPHVNVTISAIPNGAYTVLNWNTSGAEILRTGSSTISLLTGQGGSTIQVSAALVAKSSD